MFAHPVCDQTPPGVYDSVVSYATRVSGWDKISELIILKQFTRLFAHHTNPAGLEQHMTYCHIKCVTVLGSILKTLMYKDLTVAACCGSAVASGLLYCSA